MPRSKQQKLMLYLYSTPHLVGCCLGLLALLAFFVGLIANWWLFIVVGSYGVGVLLTPENKALKVELSHQMDADELSMQLNRLLDNAKERLSDQVKQPLENIRNKVDQILPLMERMAVFNHDVHTVKQVITTYLPDMLSSYLRLPPAYARFHTLQSGKTSRDELVEQLVILDKALEEILGELLTDDVNALRAHGEFLKTKFASTDIWVD
ncbi:hypothetical protein [Vibrio sp. WXL210]|uniref:hypothetical protein n=1 Tax=Vibrio sp. WXL210 TaxID=3450709 RepID=UPI003EC80AFB